MTATMRPWTCSDINLKMGSVCHGREVKEQEKQLEFVAPVKKARVPRLDEQVLDSADRYEVTYKRNSGNFHY